MRAAVATSEAAGRTRVAGSGLNRPVSSRAHGRWIAWGIGGVVVSAAVLGFGWHWISGLETQSTDRDPKKATPAAVDGARAFGYLKQICDIGPRVAGTEANARQRALAAEHFKKLGAQVREQPFTAQHPVSGQTVNMVNLIASWFPDRTERVLLVAHYDTRPRPDEETDPARRNLPFIGANDGASGVALLMEIAHHLDEKSTPWGIDILLVDGEELVYQENGRRFGEFFLGAKEFAKQYKQARRSPKVKSKYVCGILLDMVAGKDQTLRREPNSVRFASGLVRELWNVASHVGARSFVEELGREVLDDHLSLSDAGIPTADIIDFEYPHWHLASDTPENCGPESLEEVGRVVTAWLSLPKGTPKRADRR